MVQNVFCMTSMMRSNADTSTAAPSTAERFQA